LISTSHLVRLCRCLLVWVEAVFFATPSSCCGVFRARCVKLRFAFRSAPLHSPVASAAACCLCARAQSSAIFVPGSMGRIRAPRASATPNRAFGASLNFRIAGQSECRYFLAIQDGVHKTRTSLSPSAIRRSAKTCTSHTVPSIKRSGDSDEVCAGLLFAYDIS